jgi:hypothetical protein
MIPALEKFVFPRSRSIRVKHAFFSSFDLLLTNCTTAPKYSVSFSVKFIAAAYFCMTGMLRRRLPAVMSLKTLAETPALAAKYLNENDLISFFWRE